MLKCSIFKSFKYTSKFHSAETLITDETMYQYQTAFQISSQVLMHNIVVRMLFMGVQDCYTSTSQGTTVLLTCHGHLRLITPKVIMRQSARRVFLIGTPTNIGNIVLGDHP